MKTTAISLLNPEPMMVTWDILRRCNLDCTYCESTRHDSVSKLPEFEELKQTFDFVKEYTSLYNNKRADKLHTSIDFTGGEPTANPAFWPLLDYIKKFDGFHLGLTTNGTWGPNFTERVIENFSCVTVSWHAEAQQHLKDRMIANILTLHAKGVKVRANVMLHCDHFVEAVKICDLLKTAGVIVNPVPIGDGSIVRKGWFIDADGSNRRTSHQYTTEQQDWFFKYQGQSRSATLLNEGADIGRACCGGRCTTGKVNGVWQDVKLVNNWFKDWYCTVNWFFLHIDQKSGDVFHHQTCQATHLGRGPIGNLKDTADILCKTHALLSEETLKPIVCPNLRCGCGMCVPKAEGFEDFKELWKATTTIPIYEK